VGLESGDNGRPGALVARPTCYRFRFSVEIHSLASCSAERYTDRGKRPGICVAGV